MKYKDDGKREGLRYGMSMSSEEGIKNDLDQPEIKSRYER